MCVLVENHVKYSSSGEVGKRLPYCELTVWGQLVLDKALGIILYERKLPVEPPPPCSALLLQFTDNLSE